MILDSLIFLAVLYLSLSFIKFCLMVGTFPAAIGTYHRKSGGRMSRAGIGASLVLLNLYVCTVGLPWALARERHRFFGVYSNFSTMRAVLRNFK